MMKKGQGLPITIIIIAALGILVLIVIAAIFGGQMGKFGRIAGECQGFCVVEGYPTHELVPYEKGFTIRFPPECSEFERELTGTYIARNLPKNVDLSDFKCEACCVSTG